MESSLKNNEITFKHISIAKIIIFFGTLLLLSCIRNPEITDGKDAHKEIFQVSMAIKCQTQETFQLFYILDEKNDNYSNDLREAIQVNSKSELQTVKFSLPEGVKPKRFRIDLGENRNKSTIIINNIDISYNNNTISITPELYKRLLSPNIYIIQEKNTFNRFIVKDQYDPFLESTALLDKMMYIKFR